MEALEVSETRAARRLPTGNCRRVSGTAPTEPPRIALESHPAVRGHRGPRAAQNRAPRATQVSGEGGSLQAIPSGSLQAINDIGQRVPGRRTTVGEILEELTLNVARRNFRECQEPEVSRPTQASSGQESTSKPA